MRISPRNEDRLVFYGLAVFVIILFIIMIRSTPANATVEEISISPRDSDLLMTMNDYDLLAEPEWTEAQWGLLVQRYFDAGEYDTAMSVLSCESGFNPTADNPTSTAQGGWQFLRSTWEWSTTGSGYTVDAYPDGPNDPEQATMMAAWLQDTYGWSQWECYGIRPWDWVEPVTVDLTLLLPATPGR